MLNLNDREWKEFKINNLFITEPKGNIPTGQYVKKEKLKKGNVPRITVTSQNNGIDNYWSDITDTSYKTHKNFISVSFLGDVFYHKTKASIDMKVHSLLLKDRTLSDYLAIFLCRALRNNTEINTYGNQLSSYDLARKFIMLPVNIRKQPDYEFMEAYIKERRQIKIDKYIKYCKERLTELGEFVSISPIENKKWEEFLLLEIFDYEKGNQNNMNVMNNGTMPLISAKKFNNGLKAFVCENNKKSFKGNCISYNNDGNGGAGLSYYQPFDFCLDSHCTALKPKKTNSKWVMLGLVVFLNLQQDKYNHGYALNKERIKKFRFMLPVSAKGKPDYTIWNSI